MKQGACAAASECATGRAGVQGWLALLCSAAVASAVCAGSSSVTGPASRLSLHVTAAERGARFVLRGRECTAPELARMLTNIVSKSPDEWVTVICASNTPVYAVEEALAILAQVGWNNVSLLGVEGRLNREGAQGSGGSVPEEEVHSPAPSSTVDVDGKEKGVADPSGPSSAVETPKALPPRFVVGR